MFEKRRNRVRALIIIVMFLVVIGLAFIYSASFPTGIERYNNGNHFIVKQTIWYILGLIMMFILSKIDYKIYERFKGAILLLGIIALILVLTIGIERNGAKRWISIGIGTIQPAEFAKVAFIIFFSGVLSKFKKVGKENLGILVPGFILISIYVGLIFLERDLSTSLHLFLVGAIMLFFTNVKIGYYLMFWGIYLLLGIWGISISENRQQRIMSYINGMKENFIGGGYQVRQSLIAVGNGGLTGVGYGKGLQKYYYLPERHTDFILSIIAEEVGFIGVIILIILYLMIMFIGIKTVIKTKDYYGKYLALGITCLIIIQVMLNILVVLGMVPATGIPLPLISTGGSSAIAILSSLGILLNIIKRGEEYE
ncbi:MAG: putative lipid II flippase FtsW [Fusobacteriota bacterium]